MREEGVFRLYRGFSATVAGAIPSHAVHFATYENLKHRLGGNESGHHPLIIGLSGGVATMAHDAIVTPLDVVKQRLQVRHSAYAGVLDCIRTVFAREGLRAFYASYPTTVAMNVPFQTVHFAAYESFKIFFTAEEEEHGILEEFAAGGAAGALAGFVSTPLDVVKTRLQTQIVAPGQEYVNPKTNNNRRTGSLAGKQRAATMCGCSFSTQCAHLTVPCGFCSVLFVD
jgi:solute carrier family 25 iron transporter 28/37